MRLKLCAIMTTPNAATAPAPHFPAHLSAQGKLCLDDCANCDVALEMVVGTHSFESHTTSSELRKSAAGADHPLIGPCIQARDYIRMMVLELDPPHLAQHYFERKCDTIKAEIAATAATTAAATASAAASCQLSDAAKERLINLARCYVHLERFAYGHFCTKVQVWNDCRNPAESCQPIVRCVAAIDCVRRLVLLQQAPTHLAVAFFEEMRDTFVAEMPPIIAAGRVEKNKLDLTIAAFWSARLELAIGVQFFQTDTTWRELTNSAEGLRLIATYAKVFTDIALMVRKRKPRFLTQPAFDEARDAIFTKFADWLADRNIRFVWPKLTYHSRSGRSPATSLPAHPFPLVSVHRRDMPSADDPISISMYTENLYADHCQGFTFHLVTEKRELPDCRHGGGGGDSGGSVEDSPRPQQQQQSLPPGLAEAPQLEIPVFGGQKRKVDDEAMPHGTGEDSKQAVAAVATANMVAGQEDDEHLLTEADLCLHHIIPSDLLARFHERVSTLMRGHRMRYPKLDTVLELKRRAHHAHTLGTFLLAFGNADLADLPKRVVERITDETRYDPEWGRPLASIPQNMFWGPRVRADLDPATSKLERCERLLGKALFAEYEELYAEIGGWCETPETGQSFWKGWDLHLRFITFFKAAHLAVDSWPLICDVRDWQKMGQLPKAADGKMEMMWTLKGYEQLPPVAAYRRFVPEGDYKKDDDLYRHGSVDLLSHLLATSLTISPSTSSPS